MKLLLLLGAAVGLGIYLVTRKEEVSHAWRVDHQRREWGAGNGDQVCWQWPVKKEGL